MKIVYATVFGVGAFFAMNCGSEAGTTSSNAFPSSPSTSSSSSDGDTVEVRVNGHDFSPSEVHVKAGQKVRWVWAAGRHNVVSGSGCSPDGKFSSGELQSPPSTFEQKFESAGSFPYYCDPHCGMGMTGKVIVD